MRILIQVPPLRPSVETRHALSRPAAGLHAKRSVNHDFRILAETPYHQSSVHTSPRSPSPLSACDYILNGNRVFMTTLSAMKRNINGSRNILLVTRRIGRINSIVPEMF